MQGAVQTTSVEEDAWAQVAVYPVLPFVTPFTTYGFLYVAVTSTPVWKEVPVIVTDVSPPSLPAWFAAGSDPTINSESTLNLPTMLMPVIAGSTANKTVTRACSICS
jgi:hypothetical protein